MYGIAHAAKCEIDGFYLLNWAPLRDHSGGDIGRGSAEMSVRFLTEEGRTYFMQAEAEREAHSYTAQKLRYAEAELAAIKSKREKRAANRRKRLGLPEPVAEPECRCVWSQRVDHN